MAVPRINPVPEREKAIGKRLREFRKERGISQAEFARRLGIDSRALGTYEHGRVPLPFSVYRCLAAKFEVNPIWLAKGQTNPTGFTLIDAHLRELEKHLPARAKFSETYDTFLKSSAEFQHGQQASELRAIFSQLADLPDSAFSAVSDVEAHDLAARLNKFLKSASTDKKKAGKDTKK